MAAGRVWLAPLEQHLHGAHVLAQKALHRL